MTIKKIISILLIILVLAVAFNHKKIKNLHTVVTLFDEDKIVHNFSHLHESMFSQKLISSAPSIELPKRNQSITDNYRWKQQSKSVEDYLTKTNTTSLLVLHDGVIVHEDYRLGTQQADARVSWSMSKSFLSALFGIAVEKGQVDLNKAVTDYVPELIDSAYKDVPLVNVLNMASGVAFNEDYLDFKISLQEA